MSEDLDKTLRPQSFDDYIGQDRIKNNLRIAIQAAKSRKEPLDHVLFSGPAGLGKTSLSFIIANELGSEMSLTTGPALTSGKTGDLAGILTKLNDGDVLFIDEIHSLSSDLKEFLYTAMEDCRIDITIGNGANARTMAIDLSPFTLIGATTREDRLEKAFLDRFFISETLEPYSLEDSALIAKRTALKFKIKIDEEAADQVAKVSRGVPRRINRLVRRCRDFVQVKGHESLSYDIVIQALESMEVDPSSGLEKKEREILEYLSKRKRPVGLKSLGKALNLGEKSIEEVYEPYLIEQGYIAISTAGRSLTLEGFRAIGGSVQGKLC